MGYKKIQVPAVGDKITVNADHSLNVPDHPIIPFIEGDGIGVDVTAEAFRVVEHAQRVLGGFSIDATWFDWNSSSYYDAHGKACPADMIDTLRDFDAIFLGAVGWPEKQPDRERVELKPFLGRMRAHTPPHPRVS